MKSLQEQIAKTICSVIESKIDPWPCVSLGLDEPKMPIELILEDAE